MVACIQFLLLTCIGMVVYPGGSLADPTTTGYSFFSNFLSELGMTVTNGGSPNGLSAVVFVTALVLVGSGFVVFFAAMPRLLRGTRLVRVLSILGSVFGVVSGLSCVGMALTPANLLLGVHIGFMLVAFPSFLVAIALYSPAILLSAKYPKAFGLLFIALAVLLAGYLSLLAGGPGLDTASGVRIQATGQKVVVCAIIACLLVESYGALRLSSTIQDGFEPPNHRVQPDTASP
jgi:hypothetical protein